jgi:Na+-translocating ferredoxin:NAD+ oxidoreductase RnfG subunit
MRGALGWLLVLLAAAPGAAQEGIFLQEEEAPRAVFPDADQVTRAEIEASSALRARVVERLDGVQPSLWEARYVVFTAARGARLLGHALIVEEIGKHRPITFVVGLRPDGGVADVAVMAYREAYGGQVRSGRFLVQYRDKRPADALRPYREIRNIAGATLSVEAASRAVKKAQAVAAALGLAG